MTERDFYGEIPGGLFDKEQVSILQGIVDGRPRKAIASGLGIKVSTLESHKMPDISKKFKEQFGIPNISLVIFWVVRNGIVDASRLVPSKKIPLDKKGECLLYGAIVGIRQEEMAKLLDLNRQQVAKKLANIYNQLGSSNKCTLAAMIAANPGWTPGVYKGIDDCLRGQFTKSSSTGDN